MLIGQGLWVLLLGYACSFLGALQVPVLMVALTYALVGFIYNWKTHAPGETVADDNGCERNQSILEKCASFWDSATVNNSTPQRPTAGPSAVQDITASTVTEEVKIVGTNREKPDLKFKTHGDESVVDAPRKSQSEIYFKALFLACLVTILYKQLLVLCLAFIPVGIYLCNVILDTFGFKDCAIAYLEEFGSRIHVRYRFWCSS